MKASVIVPVFNEEKIIVDCLDSLAKQSYKDLEIIVVDDGSTDKTLSVLSKCLQKQILQAKTKMFAEANFASKNQNVCRSKFCKQKPFFKILEQSHLGPGTARNLGAEQARGDILVFVDADMIFDPQFIEKLTLPIREEKITGTFSKEEYVLNKDNVWSKCWNINKGLPLNKMHPENYPDEQPVFRAILKKEFERAGGFGAIGYIDDYTLADKLGVQAAAAPGAVFYHRNPDNMGEIYCQARWIGKSEFKKRRIKNESLMKVVAIIRYSLPLSIGNGIIKAIRFNLPQFIVFKIIYDLGVEISLIKSFFGEQKYK